MEKECVFFFASKSFIGLKFLFLISYKNLELLEI